MGFHNIDAIKSYIDVDDQNILSSKCFLIKLNGFSNIMYNISQCHLNLNDINKCQSKTCLVKIFLFKIYV